MSARFVFGSSVLLLAACADSGLTWLPLDGHESVVIVRVRNAEVEADAFHPARSDEPVYLDLDDADRDVLALRFLQSPELPEGKLPLRMTGRPLPMHDDILRLDLQSRDWEPTLSLPLEATDLKLSAPSDCVELRARSLSIFPTESSTSSVRFAVGTGSDLAFVGLSNGNYYEVDPSGGRLVDGPPEGGAAAYYNEDSRDIWVLASSGRLYRGNPSRGFELADGPFEPAEESFGFALAGPPSGEDFELFAMKAEDSIWRFDGQSWSRVYSSLVVSADSFAAVWLSPGNALFIGAGAKGEVLRVGDGLPEVEYPNESLVSDPLRSLEYIEGFGPLLGTRDARVYQRTASAVWEPLPYEGTGWVTAFASMGSGADGFIAGGDNSVIQQVYPGFEPCAVQMIGDGWRVDHLIEWTDGFFVVGRNWAAQTPPLAVFLERLP